MGRILAIDFGLKRCGLAVTDPARIIASALDTVPAPDLMHYLERYVAMEQVDGFVVGLPVNLNGLPTNATPHVLTFIADLKKHFPGQWVETLDERFTSTMAQQTLLASGKGRMARRDKSQLDRISATILLQGWLQGRGKGKGERAR